MRASGLSSDWLGEWLSPESSSSYEFTCTHHSEIAEYIDDPANMARMIVESKSNTERLRTLFKRVKWLAPTRLSAPKTIQLRHGDFGEVLAIGLIETTSEFVVPVVKLRYEVESNQSTPGTDIVAFLTDEASERIVGLEFCETKVRASGKYNAKGAAVEAHDQLIVDRELSFADILDFVLQRLDEIDPPWADALEDYLSERGDPGAAYRIVIVIDRKDFTDDILDNLPESAQLCGPLHADIVHCDELRALIAETWTLVEPGLVQDDEAEGAEGD